MYMYRPMCTHVYTYACAWMSLALVNDGSLGFQGHGGDDASLAKRAGRITLRALRRASRARSQLRL